MFTTNPFAGLSAFISPSVMQTYIVVMIILVAGGTIYDVLQKKSAKYFRANMRKAKASATQEVSGGQMLSMAIKTAVVDVAASGEFCNQKRRIAHLLGMYGFVFFAVATAVMVFRYPTADVATPAIWPQLWWLGAAMVCVGGYWFWFFIRVDVAAEGNSPFRIMRADLFVLSLLGSATFALIWGFLQTRGHALTMPAFWLHVIFTTVLFGSVPWSKFAHMFFKPAAAFEKRMSAANGSRSNLPAPADKPETFGSPVEQPRHY
ncbi:MAG: hypothetical protein WBM80_06145 [Woeseiaceae bacterium]